MTDEARVLGERLRRRAAFHRKVAAIEAPNWLLCVQDEALLPEDLGDEATAVAYHANIALDCEEAAARVDVLWEALTRYERADIKVADRIAALERDLVAARAQSAAETERLDRAILRIAELATEKEQAEAQLAACREERDGARRYQERSELLFSEMQRLFGVDAIGDDPTDVFVIATEKLRQLAGAREALEAAHDLLAQAVGLIEPDDHPELVASIQAMLMPCDEAGACPALASPGAGGEHG